MTNKICDICKKEVDVLTEIQDEYKQDRVKKVCSDCLSEINNIFHGITESLTIKRDNYIRRFIRNLRDKS